MNFKFAKRKNGSSIKKEKSCFWINHMNANNMKCQLKPMVRAATRMEYVVGQTVTEDRLRTSCGSAKICEAW